MNKCQWRIKLGTLLLDRAVCVQEWRSFQGSTPQHGDKIRPHQAGCTRLEFSNQPEKDNSSSQWETCDIGKPFHDQDDRIRNWFHAVLSIRDILVRILSQNRRNQGFSYYFCLMIEGSRSRSPKKIRIRTRIPNTGIPGSFFFGSGFTATFCWVLNASWISDCAECWSGSRLTWEVTCLDFII